MTDKLSEVTVSARVPRWLKEKLEEEAKRRLAPVSQIVREAIAEKLQRDVGDENPRSGTITPELRALRDGIWAISDIPK